MLLFGISTRATWWDLKRKLINSNSYNKKLGEIYESYNSSWSTSNWWLYH